MFEIAALQPICVWVAALESGEYEQTTGCLYRREPSMEPGDQRPAGHCCLGVAAEVAGVEWKDLNGLSGVRWNEVEPNRGTLPGEMASLFGLDYDVQDTLAGLNDGQRFTFQQIAQVIRKSATGPTGQFDEWYVSRFLVNQVLDGMNLDGWDD